ncbi:hypothetical protein Hanom_Chr14g01271111 [Helianthus anomalus]
MVNVCFLFYCQFIIMHLKCLILNSIQYKQQKNGWECGFMVIKNMYEFVNIIQHDFPIKLWNEKGCLPQKEIDKLILDLTPQFISRVFSAGQRHA